MKKIIIYPGRFQPMLPHHAEVYNRLQSRFAGAEVYVATSNKVEGSKSPFNFEEKKAINEFVKSKNLKINLIENRFAEIIT